MNKFKDTKAVEQNKSNTGYKRDTNVKKNKNEISETKTSRY